MSGDRTHQDALTRLKHELALPPFHGFLRPEALRVDAEDGTVVVRLPYRPEFRRSPHEPHFHGGVVAALVDCVGHAAIAVRTGRMVPTIDLRIDYLRPASGEALEAVGKVQRLGRTVGVADIEVRTSEGLVVALGRGVYSTRAPDEAARKGM